MNYIHRTRIFLIRFAKVFPFILASIVCLSYMESIFALHYERYTLLDGFFVLDKPISHFIGNIFVYEWYTTVAAATLSVAFETCWHNKACIVYLCINAWERDYFLSFELEPNYIYTICIINIAITSYLVFKGAKIAINS